MADGGGGECCIARWGGGGHVAASGYNTTSKMDMIMLKFRPIAPKPVSGTAPASEGGSGSSGSGSGSGSGRHAKAGGRGRRKTNSNNKDNSSSSNNRCNNNSSNNRRKRKSSSPDRKNDLENIVSDNYQDQKSDLTLLPLFPEAPDLSPTGQDQVHNMPLWLNFDNSNSNSNSNNNDNICNKSGSSPSFEGNYNNCHVSWW
ncbi:putative uncharacterized protein DDB_G0277255 [Chenopodium quinoa]|uniref:putative uncharacterized protein DDB_G0277255 n=1 Tax=Chenopodium quinoa TaxID=63459 RepID=UPI000B77306A|nr:putative uncharacterized protein DDB_G0277255 [Chenopodium quinoa]